MLLVVFGAGASFDSAPDYPPGQGAIEPAVRPPLADALFSTNFGDELQQFPECLPIVPRLRNRPKDVTVEGVLDELQRESETDPTRLKQLAAIRWYLHYMLWKCGRAWSSRTGAVTNYKTLLDEIRNAQGSAEKAVFVTFNYDLLLDEAMPVVGVNTSTLDGYVSDPSYQLVKLHGSVNWAHPVETPLARPTSWAMPDFDTANRFIDLAPTLKVGAALRIVYSCPMAPQDEGNGVFFPYPSVAIPLLKKDHFECPIEHIERLKELLPKVTHVLIVGWRGAEYNFSEMVRTALDNAPSKMMVVSGSVSDGWQVVDTLKEAGVVADTTEVFGAGFTAFTLSRRVGSFLAK